VKSIREACEEIRADMEADVYMFDGRQLDGRLVAEMHANLAAAVSALAGMIIVLDERKEETRR
jgi:hypothetical protein